MQIGKKHILNIQYLCKKMVNKKSNYNIKRVGGHIYYVKELYNRDFNAKIISLKNLTAHKYLFKYRLK